MSASNSITSWPRSPSTRAASRPAGPPPTTAALRRRGARGTRAGSGVPPGRRVVDALGVAGVVDAVQAVARPDARPDPVLLPSRDLTDQVRVGDLRASHPHQVEQPLADRVPRRRHVRDPGGVQHGDADRPLDRRAELRGRAHSACPSTG